MEPGTLIGQTAWAECESAIRAFESAWRGSGNARPDVGAFVPAGAPHPTRLLVELVHVDLEFRLRAGEEVRAEEYLARFPALGRDGLLVDLLAAEFALRNRYRPPAWPEEYFLRFPGLLVPLRARLSADGRTGVLAATRSTERASARPVGPPVIPGYEVQGELGRGGMGVVYEARDRLLNRAVAVKTFATVPRADGCARFAREAEAIASLDHPHIVPVYEVGEWHPDGGGSPVPYFVMKLYTGGNLDAVPAGSGTDPKAHAAAVETVARAVHHAHQRGVLHRDLKPSNILLDGAGAPHVADFGLAGRVEPDERTLTMVVGTPAYMAPEQARDPKKVSTAADVYGLGAVLYHRLTGRPPFVAATPLATLELVAGAAPPKPSALNPAVGRDLDTICLKCLEKDPARRYASAAEVADDLERWRAGRPIAARPTRAWEHAWRRARRHPFVTALVLTALGSLVGAVAILAASNSQVRTKEQEARAAYLRESEIRNALEEARASEQRALYLERVASAGRLYAASQLEQAWAVLDQCPEPFRGWEWHYLNTLRRAEPTALVGHAATVTAVAHLADGRLVSADAEGTVRVWNAAGRPDREWKGGTARVVTLAPHPLKDWVAVADTGAVTVWEVGTGRRLAKVDGAEWAAFAPDCPRLATADGSTVRLWTAPAAVLPPDDPRALPEWKAEGALFGHRGRVCAGTFDPEGSLLYTASVDGTIRSWAVARGVELYNRSVPTPVSGLGVVGGGRALAEAHVGCVVFTDMRSGEMRDRLDHPTGDQTPVAVSPDGRLVAASGANGEVVVWDTVDRRKRVYRGHPGRVSALALGPDGRLAACGGDGAVRLWNANGEQDVRTLAWIGAGASGLSLSPDGKQLAVASRAPANPADAAVLVFDSLTGREIRRVPGGTDAAFQPGSGNLATVRAGGVALRDARTGAELWSKALPDFKGEGLPVGPTGRRSAFSADGTRLATWDPGAGGVMLWNPTDGSAAGRLNTGTAVVEAIEFFPDGARLAVTTADAIEVWDLALGARVAWGAGAKGAFALAFSPDGKWLATADSDRGVRLRDAVTGHPVRAFVGNTLRVNALAFSPDGARLATGGSDRTVRVWDVESGHELLALPGVTEAVTGVAWDRTGRRLYALDHAVRAWGIGE